MPIGFGRTVALPGVEPIRTCADRANGARDWRNQRDRDEGGVSSKARQDWGVRHVRHRCRRVGKRAGLTERQGERTWPRFEPGFGVRRECQVSVRATKKASWFLPRVPCLSTIRASCFIERFREFDENGLLNVGRGELIDHDGLHQSIDLWYQTPICPIIDEVRHRVRRPRARLSCLCRDAGRGDG